MRRVHLPRRGQITAHPKGAKRSCQKVRTPFFTYPGKEFHLVGSNNCAPPRAERIGPVTAHVRSHFGWGFIPRVLRPGGRGTSPGWRALGPGTPSSGRCPGLPVAAQLVSHSHPAEKRSCTLITPFHLSTLLRPNERVHPFQIFRILRGIRS